MTKKELLKSLWDFTPEQIADAVRNGVVTEYELKTQASGKYTPKLRRQVSTLLKNAPQPAQSVSDTPVQPAPAIAPQPVFEQPAVQPIAQPSPNPVAERTVISNQESAAMIYPEPQAPAYQEPQPPGYPQQYNPIYPEPAVNHQHITHPQQPDTWGTPPMPPAQPKPGEFVYGHGEDKRRGFAGLFSFYGRIGRMNYFLSLVCYSILYAVIGGIAGAMLMSDIDVAEFAFIPALFIIPLYWFGLAQSVKRCHDLGHCGWWIFIPFYGFWLLFAAGQNFPNKYGPAIM